MTRPGAFGAMLLACILVSLDLVGEPPMAPAIEFLDGPAARAALTNDQTDPFFRSLSDLDFELRLGRRLSGSRESRLRLLKRLYADAVADWTPVERQAVAGVCARLAARMGAWQLSPWRFIKTDGTEEAGAAYTRGDCIILPVQKLRGGGLEALVAHEAAHVISRQHRELRTRLYQRLGFRSVGPIAFGPYLDQHRITNPDGPAISDIIRVRAPDRGEFDAALVLYSRSDHYDPSLGRTLFAYLNRGLVPVRQDGERWRVVAAGDGPPPIYALEQVSGFFEQIGRNTSYLYHPDEILAENLSILWTGRGGSVPTPELIRDLEKILLQSHPKRD